MKTLITCLLLFAVISFASSQTTTPSATWSSTPTQSYSSRAILVQPDQLYLFWNYSLADNSIIFEVHAKNADWIIFGFDQSPSNLTDWIVTGLDSTSGIGHFSDRFMIKQQTTLNLPTLTGQLKVDAKRDWLPLNVFKQQSYFVAKFSRTFRLCDNDRQDVDMITLPSTILFAYGTDSQTVNTNNDLNITNGMFASTNLATTTISLVASNDINAMSLLNCPQPPAKVEFNSVPFGSYVNSIDLVEGVYRFMWNTTDKELIGEIHCRTTGWVGFGLSQSGEMENSDVIIGWIASNGKVNFTDRYIDETYAITIDNKTDWILMNSREANGFTVFQFKRPFVTCDSRDRNIEVFSLFFVFFLFV